MPAYAETLVQVTQRRRVDDAARVFIDLCNKIGTAFYLRSMCVRFGRHQSADDLRWLALS